jgi:hypothetical protein
VNAGVANGARLILLVLVVRRADWKTGGEIRRRGVALQANRVHVRSIQQTRIRTTVRRVAGNAAFGLDHIVLIHKRSSRFGVALGADRILLRSRLEALAPKRSVGVVAVGALDQAFLHLVMERHIELRLDIGVALETQLRLRDLEEMVPIRAGVNAVTTDAAHIRFAVTRALEVGMLSRVAAETLRVHILGRRLGGIEDLARVTHAVHVCLTRSVAAFAGDPALAMHLRDLRVRIVSKFLRGLFVAGRARFRTNELARIGLQCLRTGWFVAFCRSSHCRGAKHEYAQQEHGANARPRKILGNLFNEQTPYWPFDMHQIPPWELS